MFFHVFFFMRNNVNAAINPETVYQVSLKLCALLYYTIHHFCSNLS